MPSLAELLAASRRTPLGAMAGDMRQMGEGRVNAELADAMAQQQRLQSTLRPPQMPREGGAPGFKGQGYFGPQQRPGGGYSTELSFDFTHPQHGKVYAPLMVPTLTRAELDHLLADNEPTPEIYGKAQDYALGRIQAGKSPFSQQIENPQGLAPASTLMDLLKRIMPTAQASP